MDVETRDANTVFGFTFWMMLDVFGRVCLGDRLLAHSAGGGGELMALVLRKWRGATSIRPVVHVAVPFDVPSEAHCTLRDRENGDKVALVT
jgi:hypothetical protein